MTDLSRIDMPCALRIAERLTSRGETLAVAESSAGGLISAALLAVPGASAYYVGGCVIYTVAAYEALLGLDRAARKGIRSATEPAARLLAASVRAKLGAAWGLAETGATGPAGNRYGDAAGHCCLAVDGPRQSSRVMETGAADRMANMAAFTNAALAIFEDVLG